MYHDLLTYMQNNCFNINNNKNLSSISILEQFLTLCDTEDGSKDAENTALHQKKKSNRKRLL